MAGRQTAAGERQVNRQVGCGSGARQEWQVGRQQQESDRSTGSCGSSARQEWQVGRQQQESDRSTSRWAVAAAPGKNGR
jgi:hypothetical protein